MIIHQHPQKSNYNSPSEWPKISHQSHWLIEDHIAHMHVDLKAPAYAEVNPSEQVTCEFAIVLHHFPGRVVACYPGFDKCGEPDNLIWDDTGTSTPPVMIGDHHGDKTFTGKFTVSLKPEISGWWPIQVDTRAIMDDGRVLFANAFIPIWANQTYNGPGLMSMHKPFISGKGGVSHIAGPDGINDDLSFVHYGQVVVEYGHFLPLSGISAPWLTAPAYYAYDGRRVPPSRNEARLDLDLHNNVPGTTLLDVTQLETQFFSLCPLLSSWGNGTHKVALIKTIEDPTKGEMLAGLLVIFPVVDMNAAPILFVDVTTPPTVPSNPTPPIVPPVVINVNNPPCGWKDVPFIANGHVYELRGNEVWRDGNAVNGVYAMRLGFGADGGYDDGIWIQTQADVFRKSYGPEGWPVDNPPSCLQ